MSYAWQTFIYTSVPVQVKMKTADNCDIKDVWIPLPRNIEILPIFFSVYISNSNCLYLNVPTQIQFMDPTKLFVH
jgi:hypothetical protein